MTTKIFALLAALTIAFHSLHAIADTGIETTGSSVNDSSDSASDSNKTGQLMSYLTAGVLAAESAKHFSACSSHNKGQCVLGALKAGLAALSLAQASAHGTASSQASTTADATDGYTYAASTDATSEVNSALSGDSDYAALNSNLAKLENCSSGSCINLATGTIKTADGSTYKVSDFASTSAMTAAGLPSGAIDGFGDYQKALAKTVDDKMAKIKLGALSTTAGVDEGSAGGGQVGGAAGNADAATGSAALARAAASTEPISMAGMQKNFNGEPIGVAADSIFNMITRRYKVKESQDSFHGALPSTP